MELPWNRNTRDVFYWKLNKSGQYTTKFVSYVAMQQQQKEIYSMTPPRTMKLFRVIWSLNIMLKWKLGHNSLATKSNMSHHYKSDSNQCPICNLATEDLQHLFWLCGMAHIARTNCDLQIDPCLNSHIQFREWLVNWVIYFRKEDGPKGGRLPLFLGKLWSL